MKKLCDLHAKMENLLESQKFEDDKKVDKYKNYINEIYQCMCDMKDYAEQARHLIGIDLTDSEMYTLDHLKI